jgi:hypothetical protein
MKGETQVNAEIPIDKAGRKTVVRGLVLAVLLTLATAVAACGGADDTTTTSAPPTTVTTAPALPAWLEDGEHFGFIRDVGEGVLIFDRADLLSGEAALEAAREDGAIGEGEELMNDFYIDNDDAETSELALDPDATIEILGFDASNAIEATTVTPETFEDLWAGTEDPNEFYGFVVGELPVTVTVSGGVVTAVTQQYLP